MTAEHGRDNEREKTQQRETEMEAALHSLKCTTFSTTYACGASRISEDLTNLARRRRSHGQHESAYRNTGKMMHTVLAAT